MVTRLAAGYNTSTWRQKLETGSAKILKEPGALCWSELTTRDTKRAEAFYTALFGWTTKHAAPSAVMEYTEFHNQGEPGVGMMAMPKQMPPQVPSYWRETYGGTAGHSRYGPVRHPDRPTGRDVCRLHLRQSVACWKRWVAPFPQKCQPPFSRFSWHRTSTFGIGA